MRQADLGLSVKWAVCNVGASTPEAYGNYYAWGETVPKSNYMGSTYTYSNTPSVLPLNRDTASENGEGIGECQLRMKFWD